jgi:glycine betaine/proline transport system ATP-binding protein
MSLPVISCRGVSKVFGTTDVTEVLEMAGAGLSRGEILRQTGSTLAVYDVSFDVATGEMFVVMGLSGCGKSTLVRLLNRLILPSAGRIEVDGQPLDAVGPADLRKLRNRRMSMVFQQFALFPHRTVRQNAAYGLKVRGVPKQEQRERADWALEMVGLRESADAYPAELSGGMKQRVGLARALATDADVMLMDEPFSALDPLIRRDMQDLLRRLQGELHKTIVFVTHDLNEAMLLGDRILMLKDGRLVQLGTGAEILATPADDYVAEFTADVDRARVLTAADILQQPRFTASLSDDPQRILRQLAEAEANGVYVLDPDRRILGVVRDVDLASAVPTADATLPPGMISANFATITTDRPLIELIQLVGHHVVPLAAVDEDGRLLGVVTRAAVLDALSLPKRGEHARTPSG